MEIEVIQTEKAFISKSPLSQAIKVGNLLFCSGQMPVDPLTGKLVTENFESQVMQVLDNLKAVVESAGSSFDKVIKTTVFLTDMQNFQRMNQIYAEYFPNRYPARSCIGVKELPRGVDVEIELIALV